MAYNEIKQSDSKESIATITKSNPVAKRVSEEIRVYTEEEHVKTSDEKIQEIYAELRRGILTLGSDIEVRATKKYIGFRREHQFAGMVFLKEKIKIYLNIEPSKLNDPAKIARNVKGIGHYSHGDSEVTVDHQGDLLAVLSLIKQAYEIN